ncbi:MAG: peptidoglycan-binding protein [Eubacteriales bacterium]
MNSFGNSEENDIDIGYLQVNLVSENTLRPIDNARIQVTDRYTMNVIDELTTNSSGQSQVIDLAAPPLEFSQEYSDNKPYSEYNLVVEAEGFEPLTLMGVQILPTSRALQNLFLFPSVTVEPAADSILIQEHSLWGVFPPKIPEEPVKPLPPTTGFIVLPEPVIPEFVVVHLGVPNDTSVPNVWVPFSDYIKNVASSEIYSTWPEQTLRANILAILSFTLNRVYTEWYRGRGYDFTITNSTAYDHSFSYERNIYSEISVIVDEIFQTFITKPNIRQPLFTQYCDGQRVQCEIGMQQWGSKDLGDQGLAALEILKRYYGFDIFLQQAARVEGVPRSFGGTPLRVGSVGADVRTIQTQLNAISNNFPAINKLRVDGIFGPVTEASVRTFQEIFNLPVSGVVDMATWYKISGIYVAVTRIAEL